MRTSTRLLGRTVLGPLVLGLAALGAFALPGSALASTGSTRVDATAARYARCERR